MKKKLFIIFVLILFISIFIQINKSKVRDSCNKFVNEIKESKTHTREAKKNETDISKYKYEYNANELGISEDKLDYITNSLVDSKDYTINRPESITKTQAISDVDFIFNVIKYSYAGYLYFGGDTVFENAKNNIISSIQEYNNDRILVHDLEKLLLENIKFIKDKHFTINNKSLMSSIVYHTNENTEFNKSEEGYYTIKDKKKYYIESIDDSKNIEDYLKLSINESGDLCYNLGILNDINTFHTLKVKLKSDNENITENIDLIHKRNSLNREDYNYSIKDKIPVVTMPRMYEMGPDDKIGELFINSANLIKKYSIAIIDIRGNPGGQDIIPLEWFNNYIGEYPQVESKAITLYSRINNYISKKFLENTNYEEASDKFKTEYDELAKRVSSNENKWDLSENVEKRFKNNRLIFVLVDEHVASSGESFIKFLKTLDNVILVGTNTSGAYTCNKFNKSYLPNSGVEFQFGNTLIFSKGIEEGIGFIPDIWSNNSEVLENVIKLAKKLKSVDSIK